MSIRQPLAVFICMVMAVGLLWSRALVSITPVLLALVAVLDIRIQPLKIRWLLTPKTIRDSIRLKPFIWVYALLFLWYVLSVVYAGNIKEWWSLTHPKFPFLLLPLAFALLEPFTKKDYMAVLLALILMTTWSTIWVQVAYYSDFELFNKSLGFGGSLPTPTNHIRYSVIVAVTMITSLSFAIEDVRYRFPWERYIYGIIALYLFYFLHILSVRTGLAVGYAGLLMLTLLYIRRLRRWQQAFLIGAMVLAPMFAYTTMSGFKQKIAYTLFDLQQFSKGEGEHYSDGERWQSWRAGIVIGNQHSFFGTGTGHFRSALQSYYSTELKRDTYERPHNQFINVFTCFGLVGLSIFLFVLIYPMNIGWFWKNPWLPTLYGMQLLSMMVEHPLDTSVGTLLFLLTILMGLNYYGGKYVEAVGEPIKE